LTTKATHKAFLYAGSLLLPLAGAAQQLALISASVKEISNALETL
jgi:hypothetical protein